MQKKNLFFFSFPRIKITTRLFVAKNNEKNFADNDVSSSTVEVNIYAKQRNEKRFCKLLIFRRLRTAFQKLNFCALKVQLSPPKSSTFAR